MNVKRYVIKIRRLKKGSYGKTLYQYSTKLKATIFAAGYQAALHDVGQSDLYVSVWEMPVLKAGNSMLIMDSEQLKEIIEKEC